MFYTATFSPISNSGYIILSFDSTRLYYFTIFILNNIIIFFYLINFLNFIIFNFLKLNKYSSKSLLILILIAIKDNILNNLIFFNIKIKKNM